MLWTEWPTGAVMVAGSLWPLVFTLGKARGQLPYNKLATFRKFVKSYKSTPLDYKLIMYINNLPKLSKKFRVTKMKGCT